MLIEINSIIGCKGKRYNLLRNKTNFILSLLLFLRKYDIRSLSFDKMPPMGTFCTTFLLLWKIIIIFAL